MPVLLPNVQLTLKPRGHPWTRDAHGLPVAPAATGDPRGPYPCHVAESSVQGDPWPVRLDPRMWPVEPGDELTDGIRTWYVATARFHPVPGHPDVDYVVATATLDPPEVP